jgi:hypothetical protein
MALNSPVGIGNFYAVLTSQKMCKTIIATSFILLFISLFNFISEYAVNTLYWDQWDYVNGLINNKSLIDLFYWQVGPHRMGPGFWLIKLLYSVTDWNLAAESYLIGTLLLLSSLLALNIKYKVIGRWHWSDVLIPYFFTRTALWETVIGTTNPSHGSLSILLFLIMIRFFLVDQPKRRMIGLLVFNFLSIFTGFSLFVGPVICLYFIVNIIHSKLRHSRADLIGLIISAASLGVFFIGYKSQPAANCFVFPGPVDEYLKFVLVEYGYILGIARAGDMGRIIGAPLFIASVAVCVKFLMNREGSESVKHNGLIFILCGFTLLFSFNAAIGRSCMGSHMALASRYILYTFPAVLGLYFIVLKIEVPKRRNLLLWSSVLMLLSFDIKYRDKYIDWAIKVSTRKISWSQCYLKKSDVVLCDDETQTTLHPDSHSIIPQLNFLEQNELSFYKK